MQERERGSARPCSPRNLVFLVLLTALLAAFLALGQAGEPADFLQIFGLALPFVMLVALTSAFIVCALHARLNAVVLRALAIFLILPIITFAYSFLAIKWVEPAADEANWFLLRNGMLALLIALVYTRYLVLQQRWRNQIAAEARARLGALQARIRPHFLFNALNAIVELIQNNPGEAEEALLDLSDLLKAGLVDEARHSLEEELALVRAYLRIEKLRLGDRLEVEWSLPDNLPQGLEIPALILQPLVENAVIHGIAARPKGGKLSIRAQRISFRRLRFEIENPVPDAADAIPSHGHGLGVSNIKQRLALAYEERAGLKTWTHSSTFHAALTVPLDA